MEKIDDGIERQMARVAQQRQRRYRGEICLVERCRESYDHFVLNLFRQGHTHVGYGEDHGQERVHASAVRLVPQLKRHVNLRYVCLELEIEVQEDIDRYLQHGNEASLERVIKKEREGIQRGLPVEGRVNGSYFDIIRAARKAGITVVAMDNHRKRNRDRFMAGNIPSDGKTLIYVGIGHLIDTGIPQYFRERTGIQIYRIWQIMSQNQEGADEDDISIWLDSLVERSAALKRDKGFGLDVKKHKLHHVVDRHSSSALLGLGSEAACYDGLLYHR